MADVFEQLVSDYLTERGYLTKLNVNYRKADGKQSGSDIDVLAFHAKNGHVIVGDCKSWQWGVSFDWIFKSSAKSVEKSKQLFKAIFQPEWAEGLADKIQDEFGTREFTYTIYCTRYTGRSKELERSVAGNPVEVVELTDIMRETYLRVKDKKNKSVEPTQLGRMVQLLLAANINPF